MLSFFLFCLEYPIPFRLYVTSRTPHTSSVYSHPRVLIYSHKDLIANDTSSEVVWN